MTSEEKSIFTKMENEMSDELKNHLIPFWLSLKDEERGGFFGYKDFSLNTDTSAEKGCILNSRIMWFFATSYKTTHNRDCLSAAESAFSFLKAHFLDNENGGVFWSVKANGEPLDTTKHTYNQAFAIYALSAFFDASGDKSALELALNLFSLIETKCTVGSNYGEAYFSDFSPASNEKLSENGVIATHTMNTLLHLCEAYTELFRVSGDSRVKAALSRILETFANKVWNENLERQEVFFDKDMNSLIDLYSYGHDIETSWLIDRAIEVFPTVPCRNRLEKITATIAERILKVAFDGRSIALECERGKINQTRVWWVQCESIVGFFNAWQKTGRSEYLFAAKKIWDFAKEFLIDKRSGSEWFWQVDQNGKPSQRPIVEPWKCPYHNGRMCFEIMNRVKSL